MTDDLAAVVAGAYARTRTSGSARLSLGVRLYWDPPAPAPRPARGTVKDAAAAIGRKAGRRAWAVVARKVQGVDLTGYIDLTTGRHVLSNDRTPKLDPNSPGEPSEPQLPASYEEPARAASPWWLIEVLAGVVEATDVGIDDVRGLPCRHLVARVDLALASAASTRGLAVPGVDRFEELYALPVDIWLHDGRLARALFTHGLVNVIELWDYGVDLSEVDWDDGLCF